MMMTKFLLLSALMLAVSATAADPKPDMNGDWVSLSPGLEFQPKEHDFANDPKKAAAFAEAQRRFLKGSTSEYENQFIDGTETYYNDYAQAWRLLGFYIDCNAPHNNNNECGDSDDEDEGGSGDDNDASCQRFLMWAAYIDLDYQGGGIGEYQFYDRSSDAWDSTSCIANDGRCAKMDCHLKDTSFTLLGFFKEPNYHEWMEQLFKHEGVCLWTDDEYYFMDVDRQLWPCECTKTNTVGENGNSLYYDTRPLAEGRIGLGLYTDERCSKDYQGDININDVLGSVEGASGDGDGSVYSLSEGLEKWNDAFDVFKVCQPCKAYNLGYNTDANNGDREGGGDDDQYGQAFDCSDDAGYTNVNQCMKFRTKTEMLTAGFRDIMLAHQQGTIVQVEVLGNTYGKGGYRKNSAGLETEFTLQHNANLKWRYVALIVSSLLFCFFGTYCLMKARRTAKSSATSLEDPLFSGLSSPSSTDGKNKSSWNPLKNNNKRSQKIDLREGEQSGTFT